MLAVHEDEQEPEAEEQEAEGEHEHTDDGVTRIELAAIGPDDAQTQDRAPERAATGGEGNGEVQERPHGQSDRGRHGMVGDVEVDPEHVGEEELEDRGADREQEAQGDAIDQVGDQAGDRPA